jgi:hypothetical protein
MFVQQWEPNAKEAKLLEWRVCSVQKSIVVAHESTAVPVWVDYYEVSFSSKGVPGFYTILRIQSTRILRSLSTVRYSEYRTDIKFSTQS